MTAGGRVRVDGRTADQMRPLKITPDFISTAEGSVLIELGNTRVICTATVDDGVPGFLKGSGKGWLTSGYERSHDRQWAFGRNPGDGGGTRVFRKRDAGSSGARRRGDSPADGRTTRPAARKIQCARPLSCFSPHRTRGSSPSIACSRERQPPFFLLSWHCCQVSMRFPCSRKALQRSLKMRQASPSLPPAHTFGL